jgi:hypothetical protein
MGASSSARFASTAAKDSSLSLTSLVQLFWTAAISPMSLVKSCESNFDYSHVAILLHVEVAVHGQLEALQHWLSHSPTIVQRGLSQPPPPGRRGRVGDRDDQLLCVHVQCATRILFPLQLRAVAFSSHPPNRSDPVLAVCGLYSLSAPTNLTTVNSGPLCLQYFESERTEAA